MTKQNNKAVLITGCSSGIGLNAAHYLTQRGFHVIASVRQEKDRAPLTDAGIECILLDLADEHSVKSAASYITQTYPSLYGLVNNGAYGQPGAVEDLSRTALREQFETNVFGTHDLTQRLLPLFRAQNRGRIVQISSILGVVALPMRGAYNASKFALEGMSDTLRLELADSDIKVSLIEPGPIESRFRANGLAHFEKHIDAENSHFKQQYAALRERLNRSENVKFTLPPERVSRDIYHALTADHPKVRYRITIPTIIATKLKRLLTDKMMDRISGNNG